jgi:ATP/maltotriose-dependent transcriptional regulator MalT
VTEALRAGLLEEKRTDRYGLRHALATQAVYEDIPAPERRRLHLRAALALESEPAPRPLVQLAHHFKEANRPRQWCRYAEAAADAAVAAGDDRTAARLLEEALATAELSRTARVRMSKKLGVAALYSVSPGRAVELLRRALEEESLPAGTRGELRFCLARLRCHTGDGDSWASEMARAVHELRRRPELAARAMINLALPMLRQAEPGEHLAWLGRARSAAARSDDPVATIAVLAQRAAILLFVGDPSAWDALREVPREASSVEENLQLLRGYHSLAEAALCVGHHRHAEEFLTDAERIQRELDHPWWGLWLANVSAWLDHVLGRWHGLESRARELADSTVGMPTMSLWSELIVGALLQSRGELGEAEQRFTAAFEAARAARSTAGLVWASARLARVRMARGESQLAWRASAGGLEAITGNALWVWGGELAPVAVNALLACGARAQAERLTASFASGLRGRDAPAAYAALALCRGALHEAAGHKRAAGRCFGRAGRAWRGLPHPYEAASACEREAVSLLDRLDDRGGELLLEALSAFERLGASWDAARVRAELRANGVPLPYPWRGGGRRGFGGELSPREQEVARLAARGWTNRDIAESLCISPRTVEGHVASALQKLGLRSRRELKTGDRTHESAKNT